MAEVSGLDEALQGEETWLPPSASTRLSPLAPLFLSLPSAWGSGSGPGVSNLPSSPMAPSPLHHAPWLTPARCGRMVPVVRGTGR